MKILIAIAALIVAVPAAAYGQTASPAHAEHHGEEHGSGHGEDSKHCCNHKAADGAPMECCKQGREGKRPACCDKHHGKTEHGGHSGRH